MAQNVGDARIELVITFCLRTTIKHRKLDSNTNKNQRQKNCETTSNGAKSMSEGGRRISAIESMVKCLQIIIIIIINFQ